MKQAIRIISLCFFLSWPSVGLAYSGYLDQIRVQYQQSFSCGLCHTIPQKGLNAFGQDFKTQLGQNKGLKAAIKALERLDSDQDGWINQNELKQGCAPQDAQITPTKQGQGCISTKPPKTR